MSVTLRGLVKAQKDAVRRRKEMAHHLDQEFKPNWIAQDNSGRCYVYRGVEYCRK